MESYKIPFAISIVGTVIMTGIHIHFNWSMPTFSIICLYLVIWCGGLAGGLARR